MTHKMTKTLQGTILAALVGFGLMITPGTARADFITFQVHEAAATSGSPTNDFSADLINGLYSANLGLTTSGGPCDVGQIDCGTWTESATAILTKYYLGDDPASSFIGVPEFISAGGYQIIGTLDSNGTYWAETCGADICYHFDFLAQTGTLGLDTDSSGSADIGLLAASGVAAGTTGQLVVSGGIPTTGSFNSHFLNNALVANGTAAAYWPTLSFMQFTTTINGDINAGSTFENILGDVSVQFSTTAVPEPATLSLLGLGLIGAARYARRRRAGNI